MTRALPVSFLAATLSAWPGLARADLKINEFSPRVSEFFEIYNTGPDTVDLDGWLVRYNQIAANEGVHLYGMIPPGGFRSFYPCCNHLPDHGGTLRLYHFQSNFTADVVSYGIFGGAPAGSGSTFRYPDGEDTDDAARDFEFLHVSHFPFSVSAAPNLPTAPQLGSDILLNEIKWYSHLSSDTSAIELFNPTDRDVDLLGYWISDGDGMCRISAHLFLPAGGLRTLRQGVPGEGLDCTWPSAITFDDLDVIYLYRPPSGEEIYPVRVDQLGIREGPVAWDPTRSFQRCADGQGPSDGFNYASSGGDATYFFGAPTLGHTNNMICTVQTKSSTWGRLKGLYR